MNAKFTLKLYTTSHCHLCEAALSLALQHFDVAQILLVEIADDDALLKLYGTRIPVLQRTDTLAHLDWPFIEHEIRTFLNP